MNIHVLDRENSAFARAPLSHARRDYGYRLALQPIGGARKRFLDVMLAGGALLILSPFLLLVALLVRLESRGPALFRQKRSGYRGKTFEIIKFRTMRLDACGGKVHQARRQDTRVTGLGRILRKTSIDELPQLLNVLRGEMSIVGPRPHAVSHDYEFCSQEAAYTGRFLARPGLTGLAQVSGCRGLTDTPEKVSERLRLDLAYVENWSFSRDVGIILKTAWVVFRDRNAF